MNTVGYEVNILLVLLTVDDMYKIIFYAMDGDNSFGDVIYIMFFYILYIY